MEYRFIFKQILIIAILFEISYSCSKAYASLENLVARKIPLGWYRINSYQKAENNNSFLVKLNLESVIQENPDSNVVISVKFIDQIQKFTNVSFLIPMKWRKNYIRCYIDGLGDFPQLKNGIIKGWLIPKKSEFPIEIFDQKVNQSIPITNEVKWLSNESLIDL